MLYQMHMSALAYSGLAQHLDPILPDTVCITWYLGDPTLTLLTIFAIII